ncbi:MAG: hypothetical protein GY827_10700 [Cytophagales bacterium]|nr:hypothetical protein [Cytophagales bacterium]
MKKFIKKLFIGVSSLIALWIILLGTSWLTIKSFNTSKPINTLRILSMNVVVNNTLDKNFSK